MLGEPAFDPAGFALDPRDYQHPIVKPFAGQPRAGLLTTPVWKYVRLTPYAAERAKVAVALANGDPLIVEEALGRGRSILIATAGGNDSLHRGPEGTVPWTTMPLWPSFPPLVQEMLSLAVRGRNEHRNVTVGEELTAAAPPGGAGQAIVLTAPDDRRERIPTTADGDERRWTFANVNLSGLYRAADGSAESAQLFAANVDPRESDLSRIDPETLPSQFRQSLETPEDSAPAAALARPHQELFRWFLAAMLLLLLAETWYARKLGRSE